MLRVSFVLLLPIETIASSAGAQLAPAISFQLNLPAPKVALKHAMSPSAIAAVLRSLNLRVTDMYRKGQAYAVTATGKTGNKVLLMVDGRSGEILGMSVLSAVVPISPEFALNGVFVNDRHPFGAVVPQVIYEHWDRYAEPQWTQPGPASIVVTPTYAPYTYAVPHSFVYVSSRTHKSYAIAPPDYRGYQLRDQSGREIRASESQADVADKAAAFVAERADKATFDRAQAMAAGWQCNLRPEDVEKRNAVLSDLAEAQQKQQEMQKVPADSGCTTNCSPDSGSPPATPTTAAQSTPGKQP